MAEEPDFGGDVVLAVAFQEANAFAIHAKGDRRAWNLAKARGIAEGMRERNPVIDAAFPSPAAAPAP